MPKRCLSVNKRIFALLLCLSLLFFSGCAGQEEIFEKEDTVTFTDALGRTVTVEKDPQRVAALLGSFADVWMLAGGSLCAAAEDAWEDFGLALDDALHLGGAHSPSLEVLFSADPDFVIASASTASNVEMRSVLEAAGITVAYFDVDCFADYLAMLDICTDITGRKDLYVQNGSAIEKQIEKIRSDFAADGLPEEKRTVLLLRVSSSSVKAKGSKGTILGEMLCDLGCINIADSDSSLLEALSVESVIRREPYHIFAVAMGGDPEKAVKNLSAWMAENPAWGTLSSVREGRLHVMDRHLFNLKPNVRWADAYEELSKILLLAGKEN